MEVTMNDFLIEDNHMIQSGTCLIEAFDDLVFVANIDFLDGDATIDEYQDWLRNGQFDNAIDLSHPGFSPQLFSYTKIDQVRSFEYLFNRAKERIDFPDDVEKTKDVFGYGAIGFHFKELLMHLWNTEGNLFQHQGTVESYFKDRILQKIEEYDRQNNS